jgi:formylglycine-generating enzyme required for sulfatase activity
MKNFIVLAGFTALMSGAAMNAQVTIGQDKSPEPFSVLELISNDTRGLRLPQLTQKQRNALSLTFAGHTDEALGLQIFNINSKCVETWNGVEWIQQCDGVPPVIIPHYDPVCDDNPNCTALYGFAVTPLADVDLVFDETTNSALSAAGAAFKMKPVTGGVFYMGSQNSNSGQPNYDNLGGTMYGSVHQVGLSSFYMSETEVTQGLWTAVMVSHNSWTSAYGMSNTHPVYYENRYACIAFCNKLSLLCGKTPVYSVKKSGTEVDWAALLYSSIPTATDNDWNAATCNWSANGFRMPTEAEWEYAARGGQKNEYTRTLGVSGTQSLYSGGSLTTPANTVSDVVWYNGNSGGSKQVKTKVANELGLYDMSGNVWEWCWDWYGSYSTCCDESNPKGAATGSTPVLRGGCWQNNALECRVSSRINNHTPDMRTYGLGFRVVCK